ncbi:hypothetical protein AURDEDRAFT_163405 [Auricularia subglabra TFB-10046 SS5]|nr:hypothetical protein AURDEDRAFT_163405 [Auricularia subglabra TFB-10046 SS5]
MARRKDEINGRTNYYVGIFVDCDMQSRYRGGGVGHRFSLPTRPNVWFPLVRRARNARAPEQDEGAEQDETQVNEPVAGPLQLEQPGGIDYKFIDDASDDDTEGEEAEQDESDDDDSEEALDPESDADGDDDEPGDSDEELGYDMNDPDAALDDEL